MALSLKSGSFPSDSNVSATFSFWIHSRKFWNQLVFRAGRSDISGPERVSVQSTAGMKLVGVSSTYQILKFAYIFIHVVGWTAIPYSPAKKRQP